MVVRKRIPPKLLKPFVYGSQCALDAGLVEWQGLLRLDDWAVSGRIVRAFDIDAGTHGRCSYIPCNRVATILLLDPVDYGPGELFLQDHERTLVHELLHLHFHFVPAVDGVFEEPAIESVACGLIALKRGVSRGCSVLVGV